MQKLEKQIFLHVKIILTIINIILFITQLKKKNLFLKINHPNKNKKINKKTDKLQKEINFYKNIFQLYVENRTEFYIKGRQRVMESIGKTYNESNIITIQDKLNWLIIHEFPEQKAKLVDKILLHEYSKKILGKDICVPILKKYNNVEEINLKELPDKFILKCNHGSGYNIICNKKSNFDINKAKKLLSKWMKINYGLNNFEYQYINIKRQIFAEKYLCDYINDYKIYCYNGKPKFIRVQKYLPDKSSKINNYYNLDWTLNQIETNLSHYVRKPEIKFKKPKNLNLMLKYAKKLSAEFAFVRVDFYNLDGKIFLGELTFTPFNIHMNYKDRKQSIYLGKLLNIKKIKKK